MLQILFTIHIIGAVIVLGVSGYGMMAATQKIAQLQLIRYLGLLTLGQTLSGFLVSLSSPASDLLSYCVRGLLYFTIVAASLGIMSFRTKTAVTHRAYAYTTLSLALYFAPMLAAW